MNRFAEFNRIFILGSGLILFGLAGDASDKAKDEAKIYQESLEALKGQRSIEVANKIAEWKFELLDDWEEENPTPKVISKHDRGKIKFSKNEIKEIFSAAGKFRVAISIKLVEKTQATVGEIDQYGLGAKDAQMEVAKYSVIRVVFKDDTMIHFRIWPKLEQSGLSGGSWRRVP